MSKTNQLMFKDHKKFQIELDRYHDVNYASNVETDCAKAKGDLVSYKMESQKSFNEYTRKINDLNQTILEMKKELFAHQETISIMSQEKKAQNSFTKLVKTKKLKSTSRKLKDKPEYLKKAQRANSRLYDIDCYNDNLALMLAPESDEMICIAHESRSKSNNVNNKSFNELSKRFSELEQHSINLELALQQNQEQLNNDKVWKQKESNSFRELNVKYFEIQDLKAQLQDKDIAISELKKLIEKMKRKHVETKFEKPLVIRQPNAFKSQRQSVLGKLATFSDSLAKTDFSKSKSVTTNNVSSNFSKPVTAQILPQNMKSIVKNTNVISPGLYKVHTNPNQTRTPQLPQDIRKTNKRVSFSIGVISITSISIPQLKSNRLEDRVMHNNSEGKKQQVEDHHRNFKFSNNKNSLTACNDSLNAKTSNVNFVCVTYGKCLLNDNHNMCVLHYINGVNSRTKMPMAVPISTREPKRNMNQSIATPLKRIVASEITNQKPRSKLRKQYEQIKIILFIIDSGCSKHMMGNIKLLSNFVEKFLGTVKFRNDRIAPILGYGDLVQGNITIKRVYYVEGLTHALFSIGQFCDADLEVAFRKSTWYVRNLKGNDLLTGSRGLDLYSITLQDTTSPNPICLMAKATLSQTWLWHCRLSHLNFDTINLLSKYDIVTGLPKLKFVKDHLCSSCELGKEKRKSFKTKTTPCSKRRLQILHMDLCGPMRVESFNGKKYVLVIVDDYSRYTWTHFLSSKDETLEVLIDFLKLIQRGLHAQVRTVRTGKGIKFLNKTLHAYFAKEGIEHQTSIAQKPEQNGIVERRNRTLVEAAQTMLSAAKVPLYFWAKAIAIARFTQNRSLVIPRHKKTPYHIINGRKPSVKIYLKFLAHYASSSEMIVETIHVNFDELPLMVSDHVSSDPVPQYMNIQTTPKITSQALTQVSIITATENINQAKTHKENAQVEEDKLSTS
ncbi:retrovirus-related pol polyprotein from transposon TNT 1-94 [Tanacetum coccineum]